MKFVTFIKFTSQGIQNIAQTTERSAAFKKAAVESGVQISEMLWLNGRYDGLLVYTAPDGEKAAATMLRLSKLGNVQTETMQAFDGDSMQRILGTL